MFGYKSKGRNEIVMSTIPFMESIKFLNSVSFIPDWDGLNVILKVVNVKLFQEKKLSSFDVKIIFERCKLTGWNFCLLPGLDVYNIEQKY